MNPSWNVSRERLRLEALERYQLWDAPSNADLDRLMRLVVRALETPVAMVNVLSEQAQRTKSVHGAEPRDVPRAMSFCAHVVEAARELVVPDTLVDPRFAENPMALEHPPIRHYAGVPVFSHDGHAVGTVCVVDHRPRELCPEQLGVLKDVAGVIESRIQLDYLTRHVSDAEFALEHLVAMGVHDMKGPLTCISAWAEVLAEDPRAISEDLSIATDIQQSSTRLHSMLMELFDMVKRRRRRLDIDAQVVPVDELRAEILRTFRQVARQRSIRLDLARSEDCTEICVDRAIFLRVLENLLDNAFAYTPDGGSIEVRFFRGPAGGTEVSVCDSGVGIDETLRDQIFSPFCGRDGSHGGRDHMGLGLTFCKLAIESHGGSIATMTSRLGGSAFSIRLPGPTPVPCAADDSSQPLRRGAQTTQCFAR